MPSAFHVRRFGTRDLERIEEIEHASFGKDAYDRNLFAEYFRKCGDLFLVAERGGRIWGYSITCTGSGRAEIVSIAVDPEGRGRGAASSLIASTIRRLKRRRIEYLGLMVKVTNRRAQRFYEHWGFTKVRIVRGYYEDGRDGIRMARAVPHH